MRKGNYGEMTTDEIYRQLGYERISLDMTTEIDGATHLISSQKLSMAVLA